MVTATLERPCSNLFAAQLKIVTFVTARVSCSRKVSRFFCGRWPYWWGTKAENLSLRLRSSRYWSSQLLSRILVFPVTSPSFISSFFVSVMHQPWNLLDLAFAHLLQEMLVARSSLVWNTCWKSCSKVSCKKIWQELYKPRYLIFLKHWNPSIETQALKSDHLRLHFIVTNLSPKLDPSAQAIQ